MKRNFIKSSNLYAVGYAANSMVLEIEFKSGSVYQYFDVPAMIFEQLIKAPSAGKYFHRYIAHSFRYRLLENHSYSGHSVRIENPVSSIDIKVLYHKLAKNFHSDVNPVDDNQMKEINTLYSEGNYYGLQEIALKHGLV